MTLPEPLADREQPARLGPRASRRLGRGRRRPDGPFLDARPGLGPVFRGPGRSGRPGSWPGSLPTG
ncbi:MAG: hypothetical protein M0C28_39360 [Candidatus Moduliflexus flocculans]|nr:hypothetical protein [Candidatus Moduliflexus flocculans]